jgi:cell wall-associated NlpC family hydrolase
MPARAVIVLVAAALSTACASTGHAPRPFPTPGAPSARDADRPADRLKPAAVPLLETALNLQGTPYRHGGSDPEGFDCSGFTQYVFALHGIALPRDTRDQFREGAAVRRSEVASGDLLFFTTVAPGASHVAIALDGDQFVHAPSETGVVRVERMSVPYWSRRFVGARRVGAAAETR